MESESYYLEKGLELKQRGLYGKALSCYQKLLTCFPLHCEALYQISEIYYLQGKEEESLAICHQIIQQYPHFYWSYKTLGNLLLKKDKLQAASRAYSKALELNPNFVEALVNLGTTFYKQGEIKQTIALYEKAIKLEPNLPVTYWNLGNIFQQEGDLIKGLTYTERAIQLDPQIGVINPHILAGYQSFKNHHFSQSITHYQKAIQENPKELIAYMGLGLVYRNSGELEKAIENYKIAIQIKSSCAEAHYQLGVTLLEMGRVHQKLLTSLWYRALQSLLNTLEINPDFTLAHQHIFAALINQGISYLQQLQPLLNQYEKLCDQTGNILAKIIIIVNSLQGGYVALAQEKFLTTEEQLLSTLPQLSSWEREALYLYLLPAIPYLRDDIKANSQGFKIISQGYQETSISPQKVEDSSFSPSASIPLRIGFIFQDFLSHSERFLWEQIWEELNKITPYLYFYITSNINPDTLPKMIRKIAKKIYLAGANEAQDPIIIDKIINNKIDILVDLDGIKNLCNVKILAAKPAPVCLSLFTDFPPFINPDNYFIGDIYRHPQITEKCYLEKLLHLSPAKAVKGFPPIVGDPISLRQSRGIDPNSLVYLSLGEARQFHPQLIKSQIAILKQVPYSLLFCQPLTQNLEILHQQYREECQQQNVNFDRIKWGEKPTTEAEYQLIYILGDILLDSYPYNHPVYSLESLWFELPLVTRWGNQPQSRVGYSYLKHLGIEMGMGQSWEEYIDWGVKLGNHPDLREEIKRKLRQSKNPKTLSPLWNPETLGQNLYQIFKRLLARQHRLILPDQNLLI